MVGQVMSDADEVLAHSEDEGEWEDEPVAVDRRPTGSAVVSVRLPRALADLLFAEAARRGVKPSEVVRAAVERHLDGVAPALVNAYGYRVTIVSPVMYDTVNPLVSASDLPPVLTVARTA